MGEPPYFRKKIDCFSEKGGPALSFEFDATGHETQKSRKFKKNQKPEFFKNKKIFKKQSKIRGFPRIFGKNRLFFEYFWIF